MQEKYVCKSIANTMTGSTDSREKMRDWVVPEGGAEEEDNDEKEEKVEDNYEKEEKVEEMVRKKWRRQWRSRGRKLMERGRYSGF